MDSDNCFPTLFSTPNTEVFTSVNWNMYWIVDASLANLEPVLSHREHDWTYMHEWRLGHGS